MDYILDKKRDVVKIVKNKKVHTLDKYEKVNEVVKDFEEREIKILIKACYRDLKTSERINSIFD